MDRDENRFGGLRSNNLVARPPFFRRFLLPGRRLWLGSVLEVVLAQGPDRPANRDVEGEDQSTKEDPAQNQDAAGRAAQAAQGFALNSPHGPAACPGGEMQKSQ